MRVRRFLGSLLTFKKIRMSLFRIFRASDTIIIARQLRDHVIAFSPSGTIGRALFVRGEWQRADVELALELLKNHNCLTQGKTALDIGSNIGTQTIYMMMSGCFSNVVAVEPEPRNFKILNLNLALNDFQKTVTPVMVAVSDVKGDMPLYLNEGFSDGGHSLLPRAEAGVINVSTKPLADILMDADTKAEEISFCWIDAEGFDELCLRQLVAIAGSGVPVFTEIGYDYNGEEEAEKFLAFINETYSHKYVFNKDGMSPEFFERRDAHLTGRSADILAFNCPQD